MLIGISGSLGSGKTEVAKILAEEYDFKFIDFKRPNESQIKRKLVPQHLFETLEELIEFVTKDWREKYVLTHIRNHDDLAALSKRPFFLHISIDAPIGIRWKRRSNISLPEFTAKDDKLLYDELLVDIISTAQVRIINRGDDLGSLSEKISDINLLDDSRLRPNWDSYFMRLADLAALRSNCMKRRVGAVIVRDKRVIATGYNGTPRHLTNCNEGGCDRCNSGNSGYLSTCLCLHAEENALLESGRDRASGATVYCNTCPCLTCSIKIVQTGVKEVVYSQSYSMDDLSFKVLSDGGVLLRQFTPPKESIIL